MVLERESRLGTIRINENLMARVILNGLAQAKGKLIAASQKKKIISSSANNISFSDLSPHIIVEETDDYYRIEFNVIIVFGSSIKECTSIMLDHIQKQLTSMFPEKGGKIVVHIVGIKSRNIAERSIEVVREYEARRQG